MKVPDRVVRVSNQQKNCETNNIKEGKADFTVREIYFSSILKGTAFLP